MCFSMLGRWRKRRGMTSSRRKRLRCEREPISSICVTHFSFSLRGDRRDDLQVCGTRLRRSDKIQPPLVTPLPGCRLNHLVIPLPNLRLLPRHLPIVQSIKLLTGRTRSCSKNEKRTRMHLGVMRLLRECDVRHCIVPPSSPVADRKYGPPRSWRQ